MRKSGAQRIPIPDTKGLKKSDSGSEKRINPKKRIANDGIICDRTLKTFLRSGILFFLEFKIIK